MCLPYGDTTLFSGLWIIKAIMSKSSQYFHVNGSFVAQRREGHGKREQVVKSCWNDESSPHLV